jgi:hypothetical protein
MKQAFGPGANTFAKLSLLGGGLFTILIAGLFLVLDHSPYTRGPVGVAVDQPVRFSHELHSGSLNIDCQYCHTSVDESAYAGIPDTHTCMSCHSQIATYSELLADVRASYETGEPVVWNKVHDLAQHVYFNHSAHINAGFGCETCHGRVDEMPLVWQNESMTMAWCLECHREPERFIRTVDQVYSFGVMPPADQVEVGLQLVAAQGIDVSRLENCSICHR